MCAKIFRKRYEFVLFKLLTLFCFNKESTQMHFLVRMLPLTVCLSRSRAFSPILSVLLAVVFHLTRRNKYDKVTLLLSIHTRTSFYHPQTCH